MRLTKVSYASLCMDADELEDTLEEKNQALAKIEHAVAQKHLDPPKVGLKCNTEVELLYLAVTACTLPLSTYSCAFAARPAR